MKRFLHLIRKSIQSPGLAMFFAYLNVVGMVSRLIRGEEQLLILPHFKSRRYLLWKIVKMGGYKPVLEFQHGCRSGIVHYDQTWVEDELLEELPISEIKILNAQCRDISKTRVQEVFDVVAGYGYGVDPLTHCGPMVVKSDINARHDGRIVDGPLAAREPLTVYQRVLDNTMTNGTIIDLRVTVIGYRLISLSINQRSIARRFHWRPEQSSLGQIDEHFSPEEQSLIIKFCRAMSMEFGALDVVRDKGDGRIYILDANKTPFGPSQIMNKLSAIGMVHRATAAFRRACQDSVERRRS